MFLLSRSWRSGRCRRGWLRRRWNIRWKIIGHNRWLYGGWACTRTRARARARFSGQRSFRRPFFRISRIWRKLLCMAVRSNDILLLPIRSNLAVESSTHSRESNRYYDGHSSCLCFAFYDILRIQSIRMTRLCGKRSAARRTCGCGDARGPRNSVLRVYAVRMARPCPKWTLGSRNCCE